MTFWAISFNVMYKACGYFLGNFWVKLGNFLFHHLVTLDVKKRNKNSCHIFTLIAFFVSPFLISLSEYLGQM